MPVDLNPPHVMFLIMKDLEKAALDSSADWPGLEVIQELTKWL